MRRANGQRNENSLLAADGAPRRLGQHRARAAEPAVALVAAERDEVEVAAQISSAIRP